MNSKGTSDFVTTKSNSLTVEVSGSSSLTTSKPFEEWTDAEGDVSSSADMQASVFSSNDTYSLAAHLEDEFRQFLVERGVYKELEETASRVLLKLLQAKRADGRPLLLLNTEEMSSRGSRRCSGHQPSRPQSDANKTLSELLQEALTSLNHWARIGIHLSNQLGMIVKPD